MRKYLIIILIILSGCYTERKARSQFGKAVVSYPPIATEYCATTFPVKEKVIKGDSIVTTDTLWVAGETVIKNDTIRSRDTVWIRTIKELPGTVITNTIRVTDTVYVENTASLELSRSNERAAVAAFNTEQARADKLRKERNMWMWVAIGLAVSWLLFIFFKLRKK